MNKVKAKWGLAVWLAATLAAIALVGSAPLMGAAVAVGGGILFGLMCWLGWQTGRRE